MKKFILPVIVLAILVGAAVFIDNLNKPAEEKACTASGGKIVTSSCCTSVGDFPNSCLIGACGCSPEDSHEVNFCDCGSDKCYDGEKCVNLSEESACANNCGNGTCEEIVCMAIGCPCAETVETCPEDCEEENEINFTKFGNLVDGQGSTEWSLVYEEPGKAALKVGLIFNNESICNRNGTEGPCIRGAQNVAEVGDRVKVEGILEGNNLTVIKMTIIPEDSLIIETLVKGTGIAAKKGDRLKVDYVGTLEDGTKFDSSLDRGVPYTFTLGIGQVIEGWDLGVVGMKIGEKRKLIIPADLAYGQGGVSGVIPPNATIIFEIDLLSIN